MRDLTVTNATGASPPEAAALVAALGSRSIALVGMMGAGKSSVGRRLAVRLGLHFVDVDNEIETVANMTIPEIFEAHGEDYFRSGEARVISRLLESGPQVLATGGGAFMRAETRAALRRSAVSVWLKADFDVLFRRVKRRSDRPMLKTTDPGQTLRRLIDERYPVYAEAHLTIITRDVPHDTIVDETFAALVAHLCGTDHPPSHPLDQRLS